MNITGGKFRGQKISSPDSKFTRPTLSKTRESIFNVLFSMMDFENKSFLDMYSGSGIMGIEALSRGFGEVFCIEKNPNAANIIKKNYASLGLKPNLVVGDAIKVISHLDRSFDVIYIDPPYESDLYEKSLNALKNLKHLSKKSIIILEHSREISFDGFKLIKQKKYSQKYITFISPTELQE